MSQNEVVVTIDGRPRPAVVVATDAGRTLVRFRDAGTHREEWVPSSGVVAVESSRERPPLLKLVGLLAVGAIGLALVLYNGGSNKRLSELSTTPSATPTTSASIPPKATATPTAAPVAKPFTAVLFGDSFVYGRGLEKGQPGAAQVAARALGWQVDVRGGDGTGYTTGGTRGGKPYAQRLAELKTAPDLLLLQGGASDTSASPEQLTAAANQVVTALKRRFPTTRLVLMGPVAMEQPPDGQLVRVAGTLRAVAAANKLTFLDPIAQQWVPVATAPGLTAATGFYPNAAGYSLLGRTLAAALRPLA